LESDATDIMIFKTFSFLVNKDDIPTLHELSNVDATMGYLVVIDKFLDDEKLARYRELVSFSEKKPIEKVNSFFNFKNEVCSNQTYSSGHLTFF
jgi:hypothetical protein